jgi:hypothetical protein
MAQMAQQAQLQFQEAQTAALQGQAAESQARATKYAVDSQLAPQELEIDKIEAITRNLREGDADDKEFERRLKIAEVALKERNLNNQSARGATPRANDTNRNEQLPQPDQRGVQGSVQQTGATPSPIRPVGGEG